MNNQTVTLSFADLLNKQCEYGGCQYNSDFISGNYDCPTFKQEILESVMDDLLFKSCFDVICNNCKVEELKCACGSHLVQVVDDHEGGYGHVMLACSNPYCPFHT